jgi:OmcA/MtrC family decaheme c-type cytochrome
MRQGIRLTSLFILTLAAALGLSACSGEQGEKGPAGTTGTSCTIVDNGDGTKTITCGTATATLQDGAKGQDGTAGKPCTVKDNGDGTKTFSCDDGTTVKVADGSDGEAGTAGAKGDSCTVKTEENGDKTISCTDGTTATVKDGVAGTAGKPCTVKDNGDGSKTISCDDGTTVTLKDGVNGPVGPSAAQVVNVLAEVPAAITVTMSEKDITVVTKPVVKFWVKDGAGRGVVGLKAQASGGQLRFGLAKLVPAVAGSGESDQWKSYINTKVSTKDLSASATRGNTENTGKLVDKGTGEYEYTFVLDVTTNKDPVDPTIVIPFEPTLTTRFSMQLSGTINGVALPYTNVVRDFVPAGGPVTVTKDVVATASCNDCHGELKLHGSRTEVKYCLVCHNPNTVDVYNKAQTISMAEMTHGIHSAAKRVADTAPEYKMWDIPWGEVTYPQEANNCRKCHDGAIAATPQGDNWKKFPNKAACGSCHGKIDFATHKSGQADNKKCALCHTPEQIEADHMSDYKTPHNPLTPAGAYNFTYEIKEATVSANNEPIITFRVLKDGTAMDFGALPADLTGSPSFLIAYGLPNDASQTAAVIDWNNKGKTAAQPASVSIANLINGTQGTLGAKDADGYYKATITVATGKFPVGAKVRAVALQGYYSQKDFGGVVGVSLGRHTVAAYKAVTGDTARRVIVDDAKCEKCHEYFEGHGGNRVRTTLVCAMCHNPNLTSSGRAVAAANLKYLVDPYLTLLKNAGYDATNPLTWPEESQNLKDMLHATHASAMRAEDFDFVRDRGASGIFYYDFAEITFPGILSNCQSCHVAGTYAGVPAGAFDSTQVISDGTDATTAAVATARTKVPNATDLVSTPVASSCASCHDSKPAVAHMEQNGGFVRAARGTIKLDNVETCAVCHGAGKTADVLLVHPLK